MGPDELIHALLENALMEQRADYLRRGRQHAALSNAAVEACWVAAFTAWLNDRSNIRARAYEDAGAELGIRNLELPTHAIPDQIEFIQKEIRKLGSEANGVKEAIGKFRDSLKVPYN